MLLIHLYGPKYWNYVAKADSVRVLALRLPCVRAYS